MSEITLIRQPDVEADEATMAAVRRFLFEMVKGITEQDQKRWYRFWHRVRNAETGTTFAIETISQRSGPFHRRHMLIESRVFAAQSRFDNFDHGFRGWLKTGAGHCEWYPGPGGKLFPVPKSTSYGALEDGEMRCFHDNAMAFLRTEYAALTLWPHLAGLAAMNMMHAVLSEFDN